MQHYLTYIGKQLGWSALVVALSLTSIVWLTQALRFVDFIVNRGVSAFTFMQLTLLLIPSLMFVVLPLAVFIAVLFVYNRMIGDSELIVLQSSGLSRFQLARPVFLIAIGATLFAYFIALYALPVTYRQFKEMQTYLRDNYASLLLQEEVFNSPVKDLTVFVRERDSATGMLSGILVHDSRNPKKPVTMMAQRGQLQQTAQGPRFLLINGNRQEMDKGRLSYLKFERYTVDLSFYSQEVASRDRKPEELFLGQLIQLARQEPERRSELMAEVHHRMVWPLYNLALGLFAVAMLLTGEFNRRGNWRRIAFTVGVTIAIIAGGMALQNIVTRNLMLTPLLYLNVIAVFGIAVWLLRDQAGRPIPAEGSHV
jgi:lipopolysaccharide export system permease protein